MTQRTTKVEDIFQHRILLVTGKGGVGKTSVTAALARMAAALGKRTLALDMERDLSSPSHLLKALGGPSNFDTDEPYQLTNHLACGRLSAKAGHHIFLSDTLPFQWLVKAAMGSKYLQRFLDATPGFQEMGMIYRMLPFLRAKERSGAWTYELLLVDLPATGHALALTSMPEPMLQVFEGGPMAKAIREAQTHFNDPKQTGFVVVTLPEPLVVSETIELLDGLQRDRVKPAALFINSIPMASWTTQEKTELEQLFAHIPPDLAGIWSYRNIERAEQAQHLLLEHVAQYQPPLSMYGLGEHHTSSPKQRVDLLLDDLWKNVPMAGF